VWLGDSEREPANQQINNMPNNSPALNQQETVGAIKTSKVCALDCRPLSLALGPRSWALDQATKSAGPEAAPLAVCVGRGRQLGSPDLGCGPSLGCAACAVCATGCSICTLPLAPTTGQWRARRRPDNAAAAEP